MSSMARKVTVTVTFPAGIAKVLLEAMLKAWLLPFGARRMTETISYPAAGVAVTVTVLPATALAGFGTAVPWPTVTTDTVWRVGFGSGPPPVGSRVKFTVTLASTTLMVCGAGFWKPVGATTLMTWVPTGTFVKVKVAFGAIVCAVKPGAEMVTLAPIIGDPAALRT